MTVKATITQSDLDRMAIISTKRNVPIEMRDERGRVFRVYPTVDDLKNENTIDPDLAYGGNSLEDWRKRREGRSARSTSSKKASG
ncbi:hypothetical protein [Pseudochrobactrum sp. MP213Fo]|uniref:hypothetical protein n=1 Tax=Pseudochrobactrum sp. MP213Fo TaxID=3022250 RepID=UPI003B9EEA24